jgi:hypothetical protein
MEKASDGEICAAMCADVLPGILMHADALSTGRVPRDNPNNPPCVCDHPVFFEDKFDRCISCGRLTAIIQHKLAVAYIESLEEELSTPHWQCGDCGSMGPFSTVRDEYSGDCDMECSNCNSSNIFDSPMLAFRALQDEHEKDVHWKVEQELKNTVFFLNKGPRGSRTERVPLDLDVFDHGFGIYGGGRIDTEVYLRETKQTE